MLLVLGPFYVGATQTPVRRWLGDLDTEMPGHRALFEKEYCMRVIWLGEGDGAALETLLIDQCWDGHGRY